LTKARALVVLSSSDDLAAEGDAAD